MASLVSSRHLARQGRCISRVTREAKRFLGSSQLVFTSHEDLRSQNFRDGPPQRLANLGDKQVTSSFWSGLSLPKRTSGSFDCTSAAAAAAKLVGDCKVTSYVPPLLHDILGYSFVCSKQYAAEETDQDQQSHGKEINDWVWMSSTLKKRRAKMNKHKLKKRRKLLRKKAKK